MTIQERLKIIGQALTTPGKPIEEVTESEADKLIAESIDKLAEKAVPGASAAFFDLFRSPLKDETTANKKLLQANTEWVFRNNEVIAKEVSTIEFELFSSRMSGGELELTKIDSHPLLDILDRFNDAESRQDAIFNTSSHKTLAGDAFWLLQGRLPNIENIFMLNPTKVEVILGDITDQSSRLIEGYIYKDTIKGKPIERRYEPEEIIHFKNPNPNNSYRGLGKVEAMANTIDLDNLTTEVNKQFFQRGAITNFVLTTDGKISEEVKKRLRSELTATYGGARNAYKVMLLGGGLKPESISMSNKDMEFLAQMEWYRDKITAGFGNNKTVLGITDDVNRANAEATKSQWRESTIRPEMSAIANTLNEFIVPAYGENLILGFKDPVPENREQNIKEAKELYQAGIITKNEARQIVGYDDVEGGEEFRQSIRFNPLNDQEAPKSIRHIDWKKILRRQKFYNAWDTYQKIYPKAKEIAKEHIEKKRKQAIKKPISKSFTDKDVVTYYGKLMRIVDVLEERFENATVQLINEIVEEGIANLDNEDARSSGNLVDEGRLKQRAVSKLEPILTEAAVAAGQQANNLLNIDDPYIPKTVEKAGESLTDFIRENILRFAESMIDTDVDIMTNVLAEGLSEGAGIAEIRRTLEDKFFIFTKQQAERITRTEVIRASNAGVQDSFDQSGVVAGKQWLAELDDRTSPICQELDGKIVSLDKNFANKGDEIAGVTLDYLDTPYPPAHPNCRSTIIPVLLDVKGDAPMLRKRLEELEAQLDKRTKGYRDLRDQNLSLTNYVNELEKLVEDKE